MDDVIDADDVQAAIEKAILAFQQIAMAHPSSDEHSRAMYLVSDAARRGLLKILPRDAAPEST